MRVPMQLIGLVRFESVLALILAATPIALRLSDNRGSISAYHDMSDPRWFFVPLTAAAMMLVTNGLVRNESHGYNATLGLLLIGVVLFDHDGGSATVHFLCAVPFFVLALAYVALLVSHYAQVVNGAATPSKLVALLAAVAIGALIALAALVLDPAHFWIEAFGVWIIAAHYLYHAWWEVRRPDDDTKPVIVLKELFPLLYRVIERPLRFLTECWDWFNGRRRDAAEQLAKGA